jgi:hypothetical protein
MNLSGQFNGVIVAYKGQNLPAGQGKQLDWPVAEL